ncbi:nSTAND1 domain-containing NTPase [Anabaena azotica]|uniref:Caspase family protein n=1 Tax=Anabaena azotica FACHB-119 TaxID=947527 RepID=A0ABR8CX17_9NOST|nr:caspase family protein [Anabaena azotica]MBD2499039.1 caspase family protein [Anabaena azotica FACHB-119]
MARYALVVGITDYKQPLSILSKPATDAEAVAKLLKAHGDFQDIKLLKGKVSKQTLGEALRILLREQAEKNEALIYFTGHGITVADLELETQQAYLATSDLTIVTQGKQIVEQTGGISLLNLNNLIRDSRLSSLVVLLDCCHSGNFLERNLIERTLTAFNSQPDYYFIAACRGFQQAYALKSEQHSIFTTAMLAGLSADNTNDNGQVSGDRLFDKIYTKLKGSGQEPIRMGWGRSITIVTHQQKIAAYLFEVKDECPYQGLKAFEAEQKEFFFGRKQVVRDILAKLNKQPFVPVIGASGSGKSSVVRAGLIPELLADQRWRVIEPIKPGFEPLNELRTAFKQCFKQAKQESQFQTLSQDYPDNLPNIIAHLPGDTKFLLVVDQFEEVFTLCARNEEQERFIDLLTQVVEIPDSRLAVVITMRADFLEPCLQYPSLTTLIQTQAVLLGSLSGNDLKETIVEPAKLQGHTVEDDLLIEILADVGKEPGFLPLLEFALTKIWEKRDQDKHLLTLEQYQKLGRLTGALNLHAEKVYHYRDYEQESPTQERSQEEKDWIRLIFLRLLRTGDGEKDTRQRQAKATLLNIAGNDPNQQQQLSELLDGETGLVKGRLLVTGKDEQGEAWIDLAHEALIEGWQTFRKWRQQDRDLRRLSDRLADSRREWGNKGKSEQYLMQGGLLAEVRDSWQGLQLYLQSPQEDEDFYQRSDTHEKDRIAELEMALTESRLREKAARVENLVSVQPLDSLVLAIQAMGENQEKLPHKILAPVQHSLSLVTNKARVSLPFSGHEDEVMSVAISQDGQTIISGGSDGTVRLWNHQGQPLAEPILGHKRAVYSVAISADGQTIVSGGRDGTVRLWNRQGQPLAAPLLGHEVWVWSVAISADGQTIVSGGADGRVRLWNHQGQPLAEPILGHEDEVMSVAISQDEQTIVSGSSDGTVRLWNHQGQLLAEPILGHEETIYSVAISADGQTIVSGSGDGTVRLWNHRGQLLFEPILGHEDAVYSVAISADGQTIVSGSGDGKVRLWNHRGQLLFEPIPSHKGGVMSVAISQDGQTIASGGYDRTVRLWNLQGQPLAAPILGHEDEVMSVAISADGQTIVSGGRDRTVRLWNLQGQPLAAPILGHEREVYSVAISADGQTIVSGSGDGTVRLWNHQGQPLAEPILGHEHEVLSVAISADGQTIVSGGSDGTVGLWNLQGQPLAEPILGHEDEVLSIAISADGQTIVSGDFDGTVGLWSLQGQPLAAPIRGNKGVVRSVAISADGQTIVSGGDDGTVGLWNLQGQPLAEPILGHEGAVWSVAISPNGQTIVSGGRDGTVRLWRGGWRGWLQVCCDRLRYHPIFTNLPNEEAKAACEVCNKYVWSKQADKSSK